MPWDSSPMSAIRGRLARHLGRLQQNLDAVGEQVREAIAHAVGRTAAEAIGEAVYEALCSPDGPSGSASRYTPRYSDHSSYPRRAWDEPEWRRDAARSYERDPYDYDDDPRYNDDLEPEDRSALPDGCRARHWHRAIAAGLQAAAWWLRRHPGQVSLLAALAVGAVAGLAVLAGHISGIAGVIASALGLAYLLDLMRSASTLFGRDVTP
jgi:hypothetical protein